MPNATDGVLLSRELAESTRDLVASFRRGSLRSGSGKTRALSGNAVVPPIRGILLADLVNGGTADCATTILVTDSTIQEVIIEGQATSGTFTLSFKGQTTTPLAWNASAADVQSALASLSTIGQNNVIVSLGQGNYTSDDDPDAGARNEFPGLWNVRFVGVFAGRTDTPLLTANSSLSGGLSMLAVATTTWADTGKVATVRAVIPVGTPTPMRAGAVVVAIAMPGVGYAVIACEPRLYGSSY